MSKNTVVFIHGLWLHASTWQPWMDFFMSNGYDCMAPPWPGDSATIAECRANPKPIANRTIEEVADSYAKTISSLSKPPILIGHSFGGLMVQLLLGRGMGAAGIAIDPAPIKGVWQLPLTTIRASFPVLGNPFNFNKTVSLTLDQFIYGFANNVPKEEAKELHDKLTIPAPGRPLFQVAFATLNPNAQNKVDTTNKTRGPLLLVSGEKDNIVPPILVKSALRQYRKSLALTELKSFPERGHSLVIDHGWKEIAEYSLQWLNKNEL